MANIRPLIAAGLLAATLVVLAACAGEAAEDEPSPSAVPKDGPVREFETIGQGDQSGLALEEPQTFKIESEAEWTEFWGRHTANVSPSPEAPAIDFSERMVIAVVDQRQPTGGHSVEITGIRSRDGMLEVAATRTVPGESCIVTQVITQPYHIVSVGRADEPLSLEIDEQTSGC